MTNFYLPGQRKYFAELYEMFVENPDHVFEDLMICTDSNDSKIYDFSGLKLINSSMQNARITGHDFNSAILTNIDFSNATLTGCSFFEADLGGADFSGAVLENVEYGHANLNQTNFTLSAHKNTDFSDAKLQRAILCRVDLQDADFTDADLTHAVLDGSDIRHVLNLEAHHLEQVQSMQKTIVGTLQYMGDTNRSYIVPEKHQDHVVICDPVSVSDYVKENNHFNISKGTIAALTQPHPHGSPEYSPDNLPFNANYEILSECLNSFPFYEVGETNPVWVALSLATTALYNLSEFIPPGKQTLDQDWLVNANNIINKYNLNAKINPSAFEPVSSTEQATNHPAPTP